MSLVSRTRNGSFWKHHEKASQFVHPILWVLCFAIRLDSLSTEVKAEVTLSMTLVVRVHLFDCCLNTNAHTVMAS